MTAVNPYDQTAYGAQFGQSLPPPPVPSQPMTSQHMTSQPLGQPVGTGHFVLQPMQPVMPPTVTSAGTKVVPGQPNMMIAYQGQREGLLVLDEVIATFTLVCLGQGKVVLPITAENLCKVALNPILVTCPHCYTTAITELELKIGAHFICFLVLFTLFCCCCLAFCFMDHMKDRYHHCGHCKQLIAKTDWTLSAEMTYTPTD